MMYLSAFIVSKLENDSKKKLDNELNHIQERDRIVSLNMININGRVLLEN